MKFHLIYVLIIQSSVIDLLYAVSGVIWSKKQNIFVPILEIHSFYVTHEKLMAKIREKETHNFRAKPLRLTSFPETSVISFSAKKKATKIFGDIWTTLSGYLNFTLELHESPIRSIGRRLQNGTYTGLMGLLQQNETDIVLDVPMHVNGLAFSHFTVPVWKNEYPVYAKPTWKHDVLWMFRLFSIKVWVAAMFTYFLIALCSFMSQSIFAKINNTQCATFYDHVFHTFGSFCGEDANSLVLSGTSKIVILSTSLLSLILLQSYSALLFYQTTYKFPVPPFKDLDDMIDNTRYKLVILENSVAHEAFKQNTLPTFQKIQSSRRLIIGSSYDEMYELCCNHQESYIIMQSKDKKAMYRGNICRVLPVGKSYIKTWISSAVSKNLTYARAIDIGILKMFEFGLMDVLKQRWMNKGFSNEMLKQQFDAINMEQMCIAFGLLLLGSVASLIILCLEYTFFSHYRNDLFRK